MLRVATGMWRFYSTEVIHSPPPQGIYHGFPRCMADQDLQRGYLGTPLALIRSLGKRRLCGYQLPSQKLRSQSVTPDARKTTSFDRHP